MRKIRGYTRKSAALRMILDNTEYVKRLFRRSWILHSMEYKYVQLGYNIPEVLINDGKELRLKFNEYDSLRHEFYNELIDLLKSGEIKVSTKGNVTKIYDKSNKEIEFDIFNNELICTRLED